MGEPTTRPRVVRGALLVYDSQAPGTTPSRRIVFQYNPAGLRRSFTARTPTRDATSTGPARESVLSVPGPPVETITLTIELDAADQLEDPAKHDAVDDDGLHGALAALELLLYPASAEVSQVEQQADQGAVQIRPADTPLVVLSWGRSRAVPVQLTSLSVTEDQHDPALNPIRAKAELGLKVLTYMEFTRESVGRDTFIAHQKRLEELATRWVGA
jgi:hypothetical protein